MIRLIWIGNQIEEDQSQFAFWDTIADSFLDFGGRQVFSDRLEFIQKTLPCRAQEQCLRLLDMYLGLSGQPLDSLLPFTAPNINPAVTANHPDAVYYPHHHNWQFDSKRGMDVCSICGGLAFSTKLRPETTEERETRLIEKRKMGAGGHDECGPMLVECDDAQHEPPPLPGTVEVLPQVIADLQARGEAGRKKYGTPLMTNNGRNALVDAYQEAQDLMLYLKQKIIEERMDK